MTNGAFGGEAGSKYIIHRLVYRVCTVRETLRYTRLHPRTIHKGFPPVNTSINLTEEAVNTSVTVPSQNLLSPLTDKLLERQKDGLEQSKTDPDLWCWPGLTLTRSVTSPGLNSIPDL